MQVLGIIPARYASSRFPGKPLAMLGGKSMIQRVCEQVVKAKHVHQLLVATDDARIFDHVNALGYKAVMTASTHQSGTDRCAEVARQYPAFEVVINIQGDEPFIQPDQVDRVTLPLVRQKGVQISTLARQLSSSSALFNPNVVKVVRNQKGEALYFSRSPIPYLRGIPQEEWVKNGNFYQHLGIYGFRREALLTLSGLPEGRLERLESLEQLRWIEAGWSIMVGITDHESFGIDTPEDLNRANELFNLNI